MKTSFLFTSLIAFIVSVSSAFADMSCSSLIVTNNVDGNECASMMIPSHSSITTSHNCNGYQITINCDLSNHTVIIDLSATKADGQVKSTHQNNDLYWTDESGNGVHVNCSII